MKMAKHSFLLVLVSLVWITFLSTAVGSSGQNLEPCASEPCENGASCLQVNAAFICTCLDGFRGLRCENNVTQIDNIACNSNPCNGGHCVSTGLDRYTCMCSKGWAGENCERDIDECVLGAEVCDPGLSCVNGYGNYSCLNLTCKGDPCENGGSCSQRAGSIPECTCLEGYGGAYCQTMTTVTDATETDACSSHPCQNQGLCTTSGTSPSGFTCQCRSGFSGTVCDVPLHVVCLFDEILFSEAETRYVDCNECSCYKGSWFCSKKFCGEIHGSFKFTASYESIASRLQEFTRSLTQDLIEMFTIPKNMLTELVVSSGSIQVDFTLVSLKAQQDVMRTATAIETTLSTDNYTFTFQDTVYRVDPSSVHFEEEQTQSPSPTDTNTLNPTWPNDSMVLIIVIAASVLVLFVVLLCVAKICIKRHKAKTKAKQYQPENGEAQNMNKLGQVATTL